MKKCCVIGSMNVDTVMTIPRFHVGGETVKGSALDFFPGGKGGNQAVALARLGAQTAMVGCVGGDAGADTVLAALRREGVDTRLIKQCLSIATGAALIEVEQKSGDNRIAIFAGANGLVDRAYIDGVFQELLSYDVFLLQFEIPLDAVLYACERLHEAGKTVILDPAPAPETPLPEKLLRCVDYITPNETELSRLSGVAVDGPEKAAEAAGVLIRRGAQTVVAKLGAAGSMVIDRTGAKLFPGFSVRAVDTTAAGDSFNAGLAFMISEGAPLARAIRFANATGAMAATRMGAQSGMPGRAQVENLLDVQPDGTAR